MQKRKDILQQRQRLVQYQPYKSLTTRAFLLPYITPYITPYIYSLHYSLLTTRVRVPVLLPYYDTYTEPLLLT